MKIAIVAAEAAPHAKAGGLADVIGSLPGALKAAGHESSLIVPGYSSIKDNVENAAVLRDIPMRFGTGIERFSVLRASDTHGVPMYLIDHPGFFARPGIYGENGVDYPDNLRRFIFFGRAAAIASAEIVAPDIVHAHDWHSATVPIAMRADGALRRRFKNALSVFTIHNLAFQGISRREDFALLNLDAAYNSVDYLEFYNHLNLMKGALVLCDGASTVSPTYAREITTDPELGFGLEGVLRDKGENFVGILNGADYDEWSPAINREIAATYTPAKPDGKRKCTRALRDSLKLPNREDWPIVGMVTRMTGQKGVDLLRDALDAVMRLDLQLVMLASGDAALETFFKDAESRYPQKLRAIIEFNNTMAHRIQAGSDAFLMPSRFEPCGLTQMYALRYGTAPVVRATGGLRDTVAEFDPARGTGNGYVFEKFEASEMVAALSRMVAMFRDRAKWRRLMANCFASDFSWDRAARQYVEWFTRLRKARGLS
ncbi:MAG TPA: glycogen synthase GlgA [Candidatus Binatus sp.]|uniref:glycogen synthase GlgA n=1 Tax=Candidatus Binatus sp. TaxID=2811406 RepID=UPI002F41C4C8